MKIYEIKNEYLENKIHELDDFIEEVKEKYNVAIPLGDLLYKILGVNLPPEERLGERLNHFWETKKKALRRKIKNKFYDENKWDEFDHVWNELEKKITEIIQCKIEEGDLKYQKIRDIKFTILVVPQEIKEPWERKFRRKKIKNLKELMRLDKKELKKNKILFLNYEGKEQDNLLMYSDDKIMLILYPYEKQAMERSIERTKLDELNKIKEKDREVLTKISFQDIECDETPEDIIARIFSQNKNRHYERHLESDEENDDLVYEILFEDGTKEKLSANKYVFIKQGRREVYDKVYTIRSGDKIRIYKNTNKDKLYDVFLKSSIFSEIERLSQLWKNLLKEYVDEKGSIQEVFEELKEKGLSIENITTFRNWFQRNEIKFPRNDNDLRLIAEVIGDEELKDKIPDILDVKRKYNGILIALGLDFSEEIKDYLLTGQKGETLSKFTDEMLEKIIQQNAPLRKVMGIKLIENQDAYETDETN